MRAVSRSVRQVEDGDAPLVHVELHVADDDVLHACQLLSQRVKSAVRGKRMLAVAIALDGMNAVTTNGRRARKASAGTRLVQLERLMHRPQSADRIGLVYQHGDLDVAGGDHLDIHLLGGQGGEHALGHARVRSHSGSDNRHFADTFLMRQRGPQFGGQRFQDL